MDTSKIIGMFGGTDATFFKILAEDGRGKTKYWPSVKNGKELHILQVGCDEYFKHKIEKERETISFAVAGNPISAESHLRDLGYHSLAVGPNALHLYPEVENNA